MNNSWNWKSIWGRKVVFTFLSFYTFTLLTSNWLPHWFGDHLKVIWLILWLHCTWYLHKAFCWFWLLGSLLTNRSLPNVQSCDSSMCCFVPWFLFQVIIIDEILKFFSRNPSGNLYLIMLNNYIFLFQLIIAKNAISLVLWFLFRVLCKKWWKKPKCCFHYFLRKSS